MHDRARDGDTGTPGTTPAGILAQVVADLTAEGDALDALLALLAPLAPAAWALPTPAAGWTIAHQIAHLGDTDAWSMQSLQDPASLRELVADIGAGTRAEAPVPTFVDRAAAAGAALPPGDLLTRWRCGRAALATTLAATDPARRLPWFGPSMSPASMASARLMETWAHGWDIATALGVQARPTARLRHVAYLGVRTRDFAFRRRGEPAPQEPFRVELTGPDGAVWGWGPPEAPQRVTGSAHDFCLLVTRRRSAAELDVTATGAQARRWLQIAQAFAG